MPDTKYCYPDTEVLINKLDIRDLDKLHIFERKLTMLRLLELLDKPINGKFDFKHLQAIHAYIFQDVYDWAGKVRTVDIAKGNMFCNVRFISSQADVIFSGLKEEHYLAGLDEDMFIKRLAYYFSEINALHPFREGNGRSQREQGIRPTGELLIDRSFLMPKTTKSDKNEQPEIMKDQEEFYYGIFSERSRNFTDICDRTGSRYWNLEFNQEKGVNITVRREYSMN